MPLPDELPDLVEPNAFAAAFSGQPTPGEDADAFVARRAKLAQLGALGPQTLPRSEKERQQGIESAQSIQSDLAKSAERDARQAQQEQQRAAAQQAREQATQARAQAAEQAKAAKAAEAAQQKQWREAGIVTRTTPEGKAEPDQHPDGTIKYKPDMLGDPYLDEASGTYVRDYRDDRGTVKPVDLEENGDLHTDAQTGERYYRGAGGLRVNLGPDDHWQQREAAKEELATLRNAQSVAAVELDQHQLALEPVKRAWSEQQAKTKSIREKLTTLEASVRATGDTGPAAEALKTQRAQWETLKPEYDRVKAEYDTLTARETELKAGILDSKKRALEMSSRLDKLKARSWGKKATDAPSPADRANSALEAAQREFTEAQDAARTLNATASVAGNALSGGATQSQVGALKAAGDEAGKAVQAQLRTAAAKVQHLGALTNQIKKADEEAAQVVPWVQKTHADMEVARAKVTSDLILGTISREEAEKRIATINQSRETAAKPLKAIESKRAAALGELAQYDDPKKWETTDLGLSLAEVDRQIEAAGKSSVEGAASALQRAQESGVASLVEGKPIKEQIATLKAELQRRQAKTPRADYGAQLAMLDAASRANATGEEQQAAFKTTVADLVAQRDAESVKGYANWGDGVLSAAGHVWSEQAKNVGGVLADPNAGIVAKTLHYLGGAAGATLGAVSTVAMGRTIGDITRTEQAKEARQLIGNLDAAGAETVLRSLPTLEAQWKKSGTVLTPEQLAAAKAEGDAGALTTRAEGNFRFAGGGKANGAAVALNRTLYGAEKVIKELEAEKPGAIADVSSSALANALPFVSSGGIEVDENDAAQVAQRAFLRVKLHEAIQKHAPYLTITGSAVGSLLGFMGAGGISRGAVGKLGQGAVTAGTGTIMGADMSLKENEGNVGFVNRLADTAFKGITLMASERIGDAFGEKLQGMFGAASKAGRFAGRALGGAAGEFTSDLAQNAMEGKNAVEGWQQSLAVNTGLGIGMAIVGAIADGKARRIGGKPLAPAYEGAMNAHTEAMAALDAAQQAGDAAKIAIATDTLKQTQAHLDLTTSQLTAVTDGTRRAIGNALGMDSKSLGTAIAENDVLATAGVAVGQEVREVYLAGAREQAAIAAAMREKDFGGPEGTPLAQTVVDQHVGAAVARDLAGVADNSVTLTADKINVLARLGLVEQADDGGISITDDAVALLPPSMRTAIERNPSKFRVNITPGNEGKIIGQLTAQGRSIIAARVGGVTKSQATKVASVVEATQPTSPNLTPNLTPSSPNLEETAWTVKIESTTPAGKATNQYRIVAATQQEAEAKAKQRVESIGGTVTGIGSKQEISPASQEVAGSEEPAVGPAASASIDSQSPIANSQDEEATAPQQGADPVQTGEAPEPAAETGKKAESAVPAKVKKPKTEKPAQKPLAKTISEAFGRAMAGDAMAKSFGGLRVAIKKASDLGKGKYLQAHFNPADGTGFELRYNLDGMEVKVRQELGDKATPEAVRDFVEAALREELIHFAQFEALRLRWVDGGSVGPFGRAVESEYAKLWDGLDRTQKAAIKKIYGHAMKPWQMGAEGVRQIVQWARDGKTTETVTQWLRDKFAEALDVLRKLAGNPAATSKHLDETIKDVERVLAELENVATAEQSSVVAPVVKESLTTAPAKPKEQMTPEEVATASRERQDAIYAREINDIKSITTPFPKELERLKALEKARAQNQKWTVAELSGDHPLIVQRAVEQGKPVSVDAVEAYEINLPSTYVKDGNLYVKSSPAVSPAQSIANPDGVPDVAAPDVTADVASKQAFNEAVQATNAQAKPAISPELEALRKAQAAAFDGLDASPALPEQVKLPPAKMAVFTGMAQQYLDAGIDTPQKLAAELDAAIGQKAHKYARAIWRAIGSGMDTWQDVADPAEWARMFEKPAGNETETAATPTEGAVEMKSEMIGDAEYFANVLRMAADRPSELRVVDVDRIMSTVKPEEVSAFREWLLSRTGIPVGAKQEIRNWQPEATFGEMVQEARRWKGAAMHADSLYAENDVNGRLFHSEATTKGALDDYLMRKFGVSASTARDVSNELTKKNLPPDESAVTGDFSGEAWADSALKQSSAPAPQSEGGALDTQGTESAPSDNPATPEPAANAGSTLDRANVRRGDWIKYTDSSGAIQVGKVQSIGTAALIDPARGVKSVRYDFSMVDAGGNAVTSPTRESEIRNATPEEITDAEKPKVSNDTATSTVRAAADTIKGRLQANRAAMSWRELFEITDKAFGGTQAEGKYTVKDAYDAMELAVNLLIKGKVEFSPNMSADAAAIVVRNFEDNILPRIPTQTKRTEEQDAMQQFSTPPHLAFLANWTANVRSGDVMLEPSAGIGGLAVFAQNSGAKVIANELSPRRREYLKEMGFDTVTGENAEQLHAIFEPKIASGEMQRPTVVVMNPPFSNAAKSGAKGKTIIGAQHVEEALKLLAPGGRLVAIVGEGMGMDTPTFRPWWAKIRREYNVRANVWMNGKNYTKYGTSFDNRLLIIDKTGPTTGEPIDVRVDDLKELPNLLKGIRNDRTEPTSVEPGIRRPTTTGKRPAGGNPPQPPADNAGAATGGTGAGGKRPGGTTRGGRSETEPSGDTAATGVGDRPAGVDGGNTGGSSATGEKRANAGESVDVGTRTGNRDVVQENEDDVFANYTPSKVSIPGAKSHPAKLVESAAMASVLAPDPTYRPSLPKEVISEGKLSEAQLENVIYAGQAHERILENGERQGYFIGDGTGVGKGRQISGIILDNLRQGRKRAVWVSKSTGLIEDAKRDAADLGIDPQSIRPMKKTKKTQDIEGDGIMFTSYDTLKGGHDTITTPINEWVADVRKKEPVSRIGQLVRWLGPDFDGVIVFDEAHMAGNAIPIKGKRGIKAASKNGIAVVDLQRALPKARIVYVSATGATEIENLSYADRLGVWGPGTPFTDKRDFFAKIGAGGISAMEIVSRDMKALGLYLARSISFKGVEFSRLTQQLTPEQTEIYNEIARGWQVVLSQLDDTMAESGANNSPKARSAALSAFWGAQQRFFNQIVTAMEMPALLADMREQLDAGNSLVLQLVNTNAASQDREIAKRQTEKGDGEETNLEDMDMSPRDILLQYIQTSYPVAKYEEVQDPANPETTIWQPARDSAGNPILDPVAVRARDELLDKLSVLRIPDNPIEQVMNVFGVENVAEITGRTQRAVQKKMTDGTRKTQIEKRTENHRQADAKEFQEGKKRILLFSQAGGTGFSFHADRRAKNQQRRIHYLVQAGWRADAALQGFGRTHRTNQASAPSYKLAETSIPGHKRFIATIARRLAQLGALTTGERKGAGQGMFTEADNLEGQYADDAIKRLIYDLFANRADGLTMQDFAADFGFLRTKKDRKTGETTTSNTLLDDTGKLNEGKVPTVPIFLNRILSTPLDRQAKYFELFTDRMQARIEKAKNDGTYDPGTQLYKASRIEKVSDEEVYTHPGTSATTRVVQVNAINPVSFTDFDTVARGAAVIKWVKNKRSGRTYAAKEGLAKTTEDGRILPTFRRIGTRDATTVPQESMETGGVIENYELLTADDARAAWEKEIEEAPKESTEKVHFLVGAMLPIWDRIQLENPKIYRFTAGGDSMLGVLVPPKEVPGLKARLGAKNTMTPADAFALVLDTNGTMKLANGWRIRRAYVSGENRVELEGIDWAQTQDFTQRMGGFMERIAFRSRYFIPSEKVMGEVMKASPVTEVNGEPVTGKSEGLDASPAMESGPFFSQLTRTVQGLPQAVMTVQQARAAIEKGAKKDEIAMSGILTDPLSPLYIDPARDLYDPEVQAQLRSPQNKVTREELTGYALERQATVQGVVLGRPNYEDEARRDAILERYKDITDAIAANRTRREEGEITLEESRANARALTAERSALDDEINAINKRREDTHFSQYQLPGADEGSYREMFVTWPFQSDTAEYVPFQENGKWGVQRRVNGELQEWIPAVSNEDYAKSAAENGNKNGRIGTDKNWQDGHDQYSDITNPIVRIRRNIRTGADGARTYFIEEMQGPNKDGQEKMPAELRKRIYEIGMKRALRDAVDEGADAIGWTTGEQQAERYDLSKQIDGISITKTSEGEYNIAAWKTDGGSAMKQNGVSEGALEGLIGKDLASKAIAQEANESITYDGLDLKVGGEGLKRLYDATLPTIARDLAKKFGGVVGIGEITHIANDDLQPVQTYEQFQRAQGFYPSENVRESYGKYLAKRSKVQQIHSMTIPDGLRAQAADGFALYASPAVDLRQIQEEADSTNAEKVDPMGSRSLRPDALDWARRLIKGRKDVLDMDAPGAADAITDSEISAAKKRAALGQMLKAMETETIDRITKALGPDAGKSEIKARRKAFVAELLPVAARLNAVGYDSMDNLVFGEFEMRAGTLNKKFADKAAKSTGDIWIGRDGEALRIGEYIEDLKAYQLHRTMTQARQARIYRDFQDRYPELAHFLNRWIQPGQADARIVDERGTVLPAFNRHALRKFFGDVSPYGELDEVEGYVPEIARTASVAGMIVTGVQNLLNKRWKSGAREYKSGDAREFGQVKDLFSGFGIRALEAYAETERRDTAEKLLAASVREIPADGMVPPGWMKVNPDNLAPLVGAYGSAHGLNEKQLAAFTAAVAKGDTETLKKLIGQAWGLLRLNKMMRKEVLAELVRPLTDRTVRNMAVAVLDSVSKSYIGGLLTHPFSWITNMGSNELFKLMRIAQQALYGATVKMMGLVDKSSARPEMQRSGSLALREAWELTKGLIYARRWNQEKINAIVPKEMFESNTGISGAVSSITEEQMTAVDLLKRANVPAAILKAVGYSDMDVKAKQALAHASFVAHAQQALADHERSRGVKVPKADRAQWMRDWLNASGPEVARQAHATAVAYAMDYENVPWWMDERTSSTGLNIIRRLMLPFIKWPYNMARQMKRFGADSALDVAAWISAKTVGRAPGAVGETARAWQSGRKASGTKLANSVAHLATFGLMYAAMRALLAAAKDDDEVGKLGRSFDMAGDRLGREWDTSSRVNITDIAGIGTVVGALSKMNGDDGSNDFWLRTRNLPYASPMMAMAATMDALNASKEKAAGRRADALESWKSFVGDFWSEGVLMAAMNTIHGNESKYTQGQGVMTTLGGMAVDLGASRVAPVPLLAAARDLVDPQMRRLNDSPTLGYDPGFIEGVQSRIPGLSKNLPPKGQVTTRLLENATTELAALKDEPRASRVWVDPKSGNVKATFVDPADKRDVPRWKTALRMAGVNVKPVDREGYKAAVKGKEARAEYKKLIKMGQ